ncbi:flagellin [Pengzhenrongella phosphoraccumulans]|uniref:flagellin N-terminal helical domain-containing protein n=1 Tax=Pengzhenrongella phosphoraccumulans TaxID=3114394 RepID=UPI00388EA652
MALSVNTNVAALNAYRNLNTTQNDLSKSLEKLSSGFRINRAADDAAGLAISEGMRSQIGGIKMGVRNAQDGISLVQTAEGALNETHSILQRMRDLSVQASNGGALNQDAKDNIQTEITQLKSEVSRIADTTTFNGQKLLDGSYSGTFQVGANAGETISVGVSTVMSSAGLGVSGVDVSKVAANAAKATVTNAVAGTPGKLDAFKDSAGVALDLKANAADYDKLNGTVTIGSKSFDLGSVKYGVSDTAAVRGGKLQTALDTAFGSGVAVVDLTTAGTLTFTGPAVPASPTASQLAAVTPQFAQVSGASSAITAIDTAIKTVSTTRSDLGAVQNRFEHTINNANVAVENLTASESRIRDTDMASEMIKFTRSQILSQAGTAMLAQAKSIPQGVLQLLQ